VKSSRKEDGLEFVPPSGLDVFPLYNTSVSSRSGVQYNIPFRLATLFLPTPYLTDPFGHIDFILHNIDDPPMRKHVFGSGAS
jgi:hypothetical protein